MNAASASEEPSSRPTQIECKSGREVEEPTSRTAKHDMHAVAAEGGREIRHKCSLQSDASMHH